MRILEEDKVLDVTHTNQASIGHALTYEGKYGRAYLTDGKWGPAIWLLVANPFLANACSKRKVHVSNMVDLTEDDVLDFLGSGIVPDRPGYNEKANQRNR